MKKSNSHFMETEKTVAKVAETLIRLYRENPAKATIRGVASETAIPKSTVHNYLRKRLPNCLKATPATKSFATEILNYNARERHLRGGEATRRKYQELRAKRSLTTSDSQQ